MTPRRNEDAARFAEEPASSTEIDLREVGKALRRRKGKVLFLTLLMSAAGIGALALATPRYNAQALIQIESRKIQVVDIRDVVSALPIEASVLQGEIEVIRSRAMAQRVVDRLRLAEDPEFNPNLSRSGLGAWLSALNIVPEAWAKWTRPPDPDDGQTRVLVLDEFQKRLTVEPKGSSFVFGVSFSSMEPEKAALVANTLAETYVSEQRRLKQETTRSANSWLEQRASELAGQMARLDAEAEAYRQRVGLIEGQGVYVVQQQLAELNSQRVLAQSARAQAEARHRQVLEAAKGRGGAENASEVLASPLIQKLREREAEIVSAASQVAAAYGPRHPKLQGVESELAEVRRSIAREVEKVAQALANEARVARMRESSLVAAVRELEREAAELAKAEVKYQQLKREADTTRSLYDTFLTRYNQTAVQEDEVPAADARIISPADAPESAAFPDMPRMSGAATAFSFVLALTWVGFRERPGRTFRNLAQVQRATGLATLAIVPRIPRRFRRNAVIDRQASVYAESLRMLAASLRLSEDPALRGGLILMVASAGQGEGKSLLAYSLAQTFATLGKRVALVDADLRRPSLHGYLRVARGPGLSDFLDGSAEALNLLRDKRTGLTLLPAGKPSLQVSNLLGSATLAATLKALAAEHEVVVVDTPPVLAAVDSRLLASVAHQVIYAVRWGETSREAALEGLRLLDMAGAELAGVVLTQANWRQHTAYEDREMAKYYGAKAI